MEEVLHVVAQGLMVPVMVLLIAALAYVLYCVGSLLVELFVERRHFKVAMPELLHAIDDATEKTVSDAISNSGMLLRQKKALLELYGNRNLPEDARWALAKRLMTKEQSHYNAIISRNEMASKITPMLGLMCTLIPLGPGIVAMGQGDTQTLSSSLLIAFDGTVAGLASAVVSLVVAKIRRHWYADYVGCIESAMNALLEKIAIDAGEAEPKRGIISDATEAAAQKAPAKEAM